MFATNRKNLLDDVFAPTNIKFTDLTIFEYAE